VSVTQLLTIFVTIFFLGHHFNLFAETLLEKPIRGIDPTPKDETFTAIQLVEIKQQQKVLYENLQILQQALKQAQQDNNIDSLSLITGQIAQLYLQEITYFTSDNHIDIIQNHYKTALNLTNQAIFYANIHQADSLLYRWYWQRGQILAKQKQLQAASLAYARAILSIEKIEQLLQTGYFTENLKFKKETLIIYKEFAALLLNQAKTTTNQTEQQCLLFYARQALEKFKSSELQDYFQDDCVTTIKNKVKDLSNFISKNTLILYPIILPNSIELLVGTRQKQSKIVETAISSQSLCQQLRQINQNAPTFNPTTDLYWYLVSDTSSQYKNIDKQLEDLIKIDLLPPLREGELVSQQYLLYSQKLYDWLIKPIEDKGILSENIDTLVIVPDGVLRNIPFSILHNGQTAPNCDNFLVNRYAIATVPGLTLIDDVPITQQIQQQDIYLLAGGTENAHKDNTITKVMADNTEITVLFSPLPNITKELESVEKTWENVTLLQNHHFTIPKLEIALENKPYRIVHIATHGFFGGNANLTFLMVYDDLLMMDELEAWLEQGKVRNQPVELLTLSACQTAEGNDRAALGLAGVALKAGVRSALATLWSVDDASTATLMGEFYQNLKQGQLSKAQALQKAQKTLCQQNQGKYSHPFYWAPFLMIGDWR